MTSNSPQAGSLPPDWFDENMHSDQFLRIIRSGLKPEPGAFELSVSAMEMAEHEWRWNSPSAVQARRIERERKRAINDRARIGMPRSQRKADEFRELPDNAEVRLMTEAELTAELTTVRASIFGFIRSWFWAAVFLIRGVR